MELRSKQELVTDAEVILLNLWRGLPPEGREILHGLAAWLHDEFTTRGGLVNKLSEIVERYNYYEGGSRSGSRTGSPNQGTKDGGERYSNLPQVRFMTKDDPSVPVKISDVDVSDDTE